MRKPFLCIFGVLFAASAVPAIAQQSIITLRVQQGQNIFQVGNGQTLNFSSTGIGQPSVLTLTGTYTGATSLVFSSQPQILGSTDFSIDSIGSLPVTVPPNGTFKVDITYTPTSSNAAIAQLSINFAQTAAVSTQPPQTGNITLNLNGQVPNFSIDYLLPPSNNVTPILNGGTLTFPPTLINTSTTATIVVANSGTGASTINSVVVSGAAFQLQGLGLLPAASPAGSTVSFTLKYSPVNAGTDTGVLTIGLPNQTFTINLSGTGTSSVISYSAINGQSTTPLTVGQQIAVPDTPIGTPSSIAILVQNNGTAPATVNSISLSGAGFNITNTPVLPITLAPGNSFTFNLTFTPSVAGPGTGTLTIGPDRFQLTGNGLGAQLTYTYTSAISGTPTTVPPGGTLLFSSTPLTQTATDLFTVTNTGTIATTVTSVGITNTGPSTPFGLVNQPPLPATLAPGGSYTVAINFTPSIQGLNTATLLVNGASFTLSGFGTTIPTLSTYQFTGVSGQVAPFTQPAFGLTLSQSYPLNLTGTLTMNVSSSVFTTDPAVQFATGGRSLAFTIPAGTTQAIFPNSSTQMQIQTGTVAETITIAPTFTTLAGGVTITPPSASPLILTVPPSAPTMLTVTQGPFATTGFSITVQGYSTTRTLSKINLQFNALPGVAFTGGTVSVDVSQSATFWFNSSSSNAFGGLFSINIPFLTKVTGTVPTTLQGTFTVTATATNALGTSNSVTQ